MTTQFCHICGKTRILDDLGKWSLWKLDKNRPTLHAMKVRCPECDREMFLKHEQRIKDLNLDVGG